MAEYGQLFQGGPGDVEVRNKGSKEWRPVEGVTRAMVLAPLPGAESEDGSHAVRLERPLQFGRDWGIAGGT